MTDEQAMWQVCNGDDESAFTALVRRWEEPIRRLCIRMTGDIHRGEDVKQEVFVRVFMRRREFHFGRKFSTWLWRIALNACYDELRRVRRRGEADLEDNLFCDQPNPEERVARKDEVHLVQRALSSLNEDLRAVLVLRHYEGLKFREISEILNVPEGTVTWRVGEALGQLRNLLKNKVAMGQSPAQISPPNKRHKSDRLRRVSLGRPAQEAI